MCKSRYFRSFFQILNKINLTKWNKIIKINHFRLKGGRVRLCGKLVRMEDSLCFVLPNRSSFPYKSLLQFTQNSLFIHLSFINYSPTIHPPCLSSFTHHSSTIHPPFLYHSPIICTLFIHFSLPIYQSFSHLQLFFISNLSKFVNSIQISLLIFHTFTFSSNLFEFRSSNKKNAHILFI